MLKVFLTLAVLFSLPAMAADRCVQKEEIVIVNHMYSGMPRDPVWHLDDYRVASELRRILKNLPESEEQSPPGAFGLGSYTIYQKNCDAKDPEPFMLDQGWLRMENTDGSATYHRDPSDRVARWLTGQISKTKSVPWDQDPHQP